MRPCQAALPAHAKRARVLVMGSALEAARRRSLGALGTLVCAEVACGTGGDWLVGKGHPLSRDS